MKKYLSIFYCAVLGIMFSYCHSSQQNVTKVQLPRGEGWLILGINYDDVKKQYPQLISTADTNPNYYTFESREFIPNCRTFLKFKKESGKLEYLYIYYLHDINNAEFRYQLTQVENKYGPENRENHEDGFEHYDWYDGSTTLYMIYNINTLSLEKGFIDKNFVRN